MNIETYICMNAPDHIPKQLENPVKLVGALRDSTEIVNPVFDVTSATPLTCNYCYISEFSRYYFVEVEVIRTGLYRLHCKCDVLQTYSAEFLNIPCIIGRSTSLYNAYIPDNKRGFYQDTVTEYITIGNVGNVDSIVLVTAG